MSAPRIASRAEWLAERQALLVAEKAHTRAYDELMAKRRALPWVKVEEDYRFDSIDGPKSLSDLFAGRSQLFIYHFMLGPSWEAPCSGCSFLADHVDAARRHFEHADLSFAAVSRASVPEIEEAGDASDGISPGFRLAGIPSTTTTVSPSPRNRSLPVVRSTTTLPTMANTRISTARASSPRTTTGISTTPTVAMPARANALPAHSISSTSLRRAVTKAMASCAGSAFMMNMRTRLRPAAVALPRKNHEHHHSLDRRLRLRSHPIRSNRRARAIAALSLPRLPAFQRRAVLVLCDCAKGILHRAAGRAAVPCFSQRGGRTDPSRLLRRLRLAAFRQSGCGAPPRPDPHCQPG